MASGVGIPKDKQDLIWQPVQQADASISRNFDGTGLGLTISRELVSLLGGEFHLNSEEGHGSTFAFFLPEDFTPKGALMEPASGEAVGEPIVAAIDDDRGCLWVRGDTGLAMPRRVVPDALILNLGLPGHRGEVLFGEVRSNPRLRFTKVAIISRQDALDAEITSSLALTSSCPTFRVRSCSGASAAYWACTTRRSSCIRRRSSPAPRWRSSARGP